MLDVLEMLTNERYARDAAREANRTEATAHGMRWALDALDCLRANGFPNASVAHMDNGHGWAKGKRDPGPFAEYRPQGVWE